MTARSRSKKSVSDKICIRRFFSKFYMFVHFVEKCKLKNNRCFSKKIDLNPKLSTALCSKTFQKLRFFKYAISPET
jgi:hypothetical protein